MPSDKKQVYRGWTIEPTNEGYIRATNPKTRAYGIFRTKVAARVWIDEWVKDKNGER